MIKVLMICHGNICRSPMAEFILKDMVSKRHIADKFIIASAATSTEEIWGDIGNPVYPPAREKLASVGISCKGKFAQRITRAECDEADMLIVMDENNRRNLAPFIGENGYKVASLLSFAGLDRDISDPWYTGNFSETYADVKLGLDALWEQVK